MTINMEYVGYAVGILAIVYSMYTKIKADCMRKAIEKVAEAEKRTDLTGEERYNMALGNLEKELPGTFIQSLIRNVLAELINHAYKNSREFAQGYAKLKTGETLDDLVGKLATPDEDTSEDMILDEDTE